MQPDDIQIEPLTEGELVERIDLRELTPAFDGNHDHQWVDDPDDFTDGYTAQICSIQGCWMGRLLSR